VAGQKRVVEKVWREFFSNPSQWSDHRSEKAIGTCVLAILLLMQNVGIGFLAFMIDSLVFTKTTEE
jgi:hypothetical protein